MAKQHNYRNTRPESPKGQVFARFMEKGEDAATKLAEKLEVAGVRYRRWFRTWAEGGDKPGTGYIPPASEGKAAPVKKAAAPKKATPAKKAPVKKAAPAKKTPAKATPKKAAPAKKVAAPKKAAPKPAASKANSAHHTDASEPAAA